MGREELPKGAALRQRASCSSGHSPIPIGRVTILGQSCGKHQELPATCLQGLGSFSLPPCAFFLATLHRPPRTLPSKRARARRGSGAASRRREGGHRKACPSRKSSETAGGPVDGLRSSESWKRTPETPAGHPFILQLAHQSQHSGDLPKAARDSSDTERRRAGSSGGQLCPLCYTLLPPCLFPSLPPPKWSGEQ